jgi:hypothetical protein
MRRDIPYAIMVPIVVVCFAMILMIWAMSGTSGGRIESQGPIASTTGTASPQPSGNAVRAPAAPGNDTAAALARPRAWRQEPR